MDKVPFEKVTDTAEKIFGAFNKYMTGNSRKNRWCFIHRFGNRQSIRVLQEGILRQGVCIFSLHSVAGVGANVSQTSRN